MFERGRVCLLLAQYHFPDFDLDKDAIVFHKSTIVERIDVYKLRATWRNIHILHGSLETRRLRIRDEALHDIGTSDAWDVAVSWELVDETELHGLRERPYQTAIVLRFHQYEEERNMRPLSQSVTVEVEPCTELVAVAVCERRCRVERGDSTVDGLFRACSDVVDLPNQCTVCGGVLDERWEWWEMWLCSITLYTPQKPIHTRCK